MSASRNAGAEPRVTDPFQEEQTVMILVGLIASGKSTFAEALEAHLPRFCRCNQDDLGSRQQVEELAYDTLSEGRSPCIDRTNFNVIQRSHWSAIARAFPGTSVSIIVFDTPYHVCASRLERRTSHPTIKDAQQGVAVLRKFASDFQMPSPEEWYDHIIYLRPADHPRPEYTRDDILSILGRLKASSRDAATTATQRRIEPYFGHGAESYSRTNRARGYRSGGYQGPPRQRGTLHGSQFASKAGRPSDPNWRRSSYGVTTNRGRSDHHRSASATNVPPMEGSKGSGSAEERDNST